jgi:adenylosuccinate synthase
MVEQYTDFKGKHAGATIYVVGSGATLNYIPTGFLDDKTVVCITDQGRR